MLRHHRVTLECVFRHVGGQSYSKLSRNPRREIAALRRGGKESRPIGGGAEAARDRSGERFRVITVELRVLHDKYEIGAITTQRLTPGRNPGPPEHDGVHL